MGIRDEWMTDWGMPSPTLAQAARAATAAGALGQVRGTSMLSAGQCPAVIPARNRTVRLDVGETQERASAKQGREQSLVTDKPLQKQGSAPFAANCAAH